MNATTTQDIIRLDAWRGVFEKTNRILSEQRVTVQIVPEDQLPHAMQEVAGWTDGLDIHLNGKMAREMIRQNDPLSAVLRLKGLNYHELCHVLYTPRMNDDIVRRVIETARKTGSHKWWYAFNALEDQRIETWFTATYGASRRYFEAVILEWIIKNGNAEAAILVYGRKYLSPRIRVQAGRVFKKKYDKALYDEFKTVIDEYITLVLPSDAVRAYECIRRFVELLTQMQAAHNAGLPPLVIQDNGMHDHGNPPQKQDPSVSRTGRVLVKQARKAKERAEEVIDDAIDADAEEEARREEELAQKDQGKPSDDADGQDGQTQDDSQDDPQEAGDGDAGDGQDQDGSSDAESLKGDGEAGDDAQAGQDANDGDAWDNWADGRDQNQTPSDSAGDGAGSEAGDFGTGNGADDRSLEDELRDMVDNAYDDMDDVRDDDWVQEDAKNILDAVRAIENNGRMEAQGREARNSVIPPSESTRLAVRRVTNILTRIRQEAEPETLKRQVHGRVDIRRALTRQAHEVDIFKQWDSGSEEETGMEAVVLMDTSISMAGCIRDASNAMWAMKRAFDKLDIRTTVMLYNTEHLVLFQPSDKANAAGVPDVKADGGTNPMSALVQAQRILTKSQSPNKVLITVTDGQWGCNDSDVLRVLKPLHRQGVVTMLLGLDDAKRNYGKHHHLEAHDLQSVSELPKAALKLVGGIMRAATLV